MCNENESVNQEITKTGYIKPKGLNLTIKYDNDFIHIHNYKKYLNRGDLKSLRKEFNTNFKKIRDINRFNTKDFYVIGYKESTNNNILESSYMGYYINVFTFDKIIIDRDTDNYYRYLYSYIFNDIILSRKKNDNWTDALHIYSDHDNYNFIHHDISHLNIYKVNHNDNTKHILDKWKFLKDLKSINEN